MSFEYKFTLENWEQFWKELLKSLTDKDLVRDLKAIHEASRLDFEKRCLRRIINW